MDDLESRIEFGYKAVESQIEYFTRQYGEVASDWKSDGSRVTEADLHLSQLFSDILIRAFPEDQFFSEELEHGDEGIPVKDGYSWLLDPIDGTNNFARSIPTCAISLGLLKDGNPVYGFIYDFPSRKLLHGGPGKGLFVDRESYSPKKSDGLSKQSVICVQNLGKDRAIADENALQREFKIRGFGSSALHVGYAAMGWVDGAIAHRVKSWDIVAGVAMLMASGGCTRFFDTEVFPLKTFSVRARGFAHIAGSKEMCDAIEDTIGRKCQYES